MTEMSSQSSHKLTITLPVGLFEKTDRLAEHDYGGRSDIIRQALLQFIRDPHNELIADPGNIAVAKFYEYVKDDHPYLNPADTEFIKFLYEQKIQQERNVGKV